MKPKARFTPLSLLILLTGCASTSTPIQYDNSHSRAHNIAHAGGLYQTEDKVIPMKDFEAFKLAKTAAGNTLLFTSSVGAGLELNEGLGLGHCWSSLIPLHETALLLGCLYKKRHLLETHSKSCSTTSTQPSKPCFKNNLLTMSARMAIQNKR